MNRREQTKRLKAIFDHHETLCCTTDPAIRIEQLKVLRAVRADVMADMMSTIWTERKEIIR